MRVSNEMIENYIKPAVRKKCLKQDDVAMFPVYVAIENAVNFVNEMDCNIEKYSSSYRGMNLDVIMLPSGLAKCLSPREIKFDINNANQPNLKKHEYSKDETFSYSSIERTSERPFWKKVPDLEYNYSKFLADLGTIQKAMRVSEVTLNTSVAQAIRDVDLLSIIDQIVVDTDNVKWDGEIGKEFVPYFIDSKVYFGMDKSLYTGDYKRMIESWFNTSAHDIFTK